MSDLNVIACKNCKYFNTSSYEDETPGGFYRPHSEISSYDSEQNTFRDPFGKSIFTGTVRMDVSLLTMCCHPSCFKSETVTDHVNGTYIIRKRINGQGLLNRNNDCKLYKRDWWKFWA